jgi:hypothetical protein
MTASNEARATTASNETKQGASLLEINALSPVLLNGFLTKKFIVSNMLSLTIL